MRAAGDNQARRACLPVRRAFVPRIRLPGRARYQFKQLAIKRGRMIPADPVADFIESIENHHTRLRANHGDQLLGVNTFGGIAADCLENNIRKFAYDRLARIGGWNQSSEIEINRCRFIAIAG